MNNNDVIVKESNLNDLIKNNSEYFRDNIKIQTYDLCLKYVDINGLVLEYVESKFKTYELCLRAIKQNTDSIKFVPEGNKTYEMYLEGVKINPSFIKSVPEICKCNELYKEVLRRSPKFIKEIVNPDKELIDFIIDINVFNIQFINKPNRDIKLKISKKNGLCIKYFKDKDFEICHAAVIQNPKALKYIPSKFQSEEICSLSLKKDNSCYIYIKNDKMKNKMILKYVNNQKSVPVIQKKEE